MFCKVVCSEIDTINLLMYKKIAIVHDYLDVYGGAESVVQAIWELYPDADIYSSTCDEKIIKKFNLFGGQTNKIFYPKWKNKVPKIIKWFVNKLLVADLPLYFYSLDLSKYDLIISSTAHFAKCLRTNKNQMHISYIHTPPRFLYGLKGDIRKRSNPVIKTLLFPLDTILRFIDMKAAQFPDFLLCNSETVRSRIKKFYKRDAKVIFPFANINLSVESLEPKAFEFLPNNFYLLISRLAAFKNIDFVIETCGKNHITLVVAGTGPDRDRLSQLCEKFSSVKMLGFVSDENKSWLLKNCSAFICAVKDEDFGMATLEPMFFGKPVCVLKSGGNTETVIENVNGVFFDDLTEQLFLEALNKLGKMNLDSEKIKLSVVKFNKERFKKEFAAFIEKGSDPIY
jgi:glycosyltransferase involved in cell wall biosynthesis